MAEFLLELMSEEIPARMQARAAEDLRRLLTEKLNAAGLEYGDATSYVTPRRLTCVIDGLPDKQPDVSEERKGPREGAPDKALDGFMRANGLSSIDEAELRETDKGKFYFVVREIAGRPTREVLPEIIVDVLGGLGWPKSMRWARTRFRWVRPLHGILALLDGEGLKGALDLGEGAEVAFGDTTRGHPIMCPDAFEVSGFADYQAKLAEAKVMLDPAERRRRIADEAEALAKAEGLSLKADPGLLDEVTGLVEYPQALMGRIDDDFMTLPAEVLSTSMKAHQKYFSLEDKEGRLANRFIVVANMAAPEGATIRENIVAGNERVLRARLADAQFFWDQDRKQPLDNHVPELQDVIFHAQLGSMHHKVDRLEALALGIHAVLDQGDRDHVRSAARLAKADLVTGMVGEFPELQGIMGGHYARAEGEPEDVAQAIAEHYSPLGPNDRCPSGPVSVCVALADKIDTLTGFFVIGQKPTGSKDPYALRRAALGIIRIVLENKLRLPLSDVLEDAYRMQPTEAQHSMISRLAAAGTAGQTRSAAESVELGEHALSDEVLGFLADRLKVALRDRGVRHDLISAVFAVDKLDDGGAGGREDDFVRLLARVRALGEFLETEDGANLLTAYRRAANIVRIEEKKDDTVYGGEVKADRLSEDAERALADALAESGQAATEALREEDFKAAMAALARLRQPLDAFFDTVTVNAKDPALRRNRLRLLRQIERTLARVADFSKIEG